MTIRSFLVAVILGGLIGQAFIPLLEAVGLRSSPTLNVREFYLPDGTRCVIVADGRALACEWITKNP